jgi:hypothetical protein
MLKFKLETSKSNIILDYYTLLLNFNRFYYTVVP